MITLGELVAELIEETVAVEVKVKVAQTAGVAAGIEDAKSRAPVLTGALRDSIGPDGEGGYGTDLRYAGPVEWGTYKDAPQPYMGPSADRAEEVFVTGITATIGP